MWDADGQLALTAELPQPLDLPSHCAAREGKKEYSERKDSLFCLAMWRKVHYCTISTIFVLVNKVTFLNDIHQVSYVPAADCLQNNSKL